MLTKSRSLKIAIVLIACLGFVGTASASIIVSRTPNDPVVVGLDGYPVVGGSQLGGSTSNAMLAVSWYNGVSVTDAAIYAYLGRDPQDPTLSTPGSVFTANFWLTTSFNWFSTVGYAGLVSSLGDPTDPTNVNATQVQVANAGEYLKYQLFSGVTLLPGQTYYLVASGVDGDGRGIWVAGWDNIKETSPSYIGSDYYFDYVGEGEPGFTPAWEYSSTGTSFQVEATFTPAPEPATYLVIGAGLIGLGFIRRKK